LYCGNREAFVAFRAAGIHIRIAGDELQASSPDTETDCPPVVIVCGRCGHDRVEIDDEFWERFLATREMASCRTWSQIEASP